MLAFTNADKSMQNNMQAKVPAGQIDQEPIHAGSMIRRTFKVAKLVPNLREPHHFAEAPRILSKPKTGPGKNSQEVRGPSTGQATEARLMENRVSRKPILF